MVDFSDLDDLDSAPVRPDRTAGQPQPAGTAPAMMRCTKCSGSGHTRWGECFRCKGTGQVSHEYDKRRAAYDKGERTKAANAQRAQVGHGTKADQWRAQYPAEAARHEATLCGPHGRDHSTPPPPLSWGWLALAAVATLVVIGAALVHHGVLP